MIQGLSFFLFLDGNDSLNAVVTNYVMNLIISFIKISFLINAGPVCSAQSFLKIIIICLRQDMHHRSDFLFIFIFWIIQNENKTRNKSITLKAMQYRLDIVTRMPIAPVEFITISIVTIRSLWHNSAADFCIMENFRRKFANLVAPPTDRTTKRSVRCKTHPVL